LDQSYTCHLTAPERTLEGIASSWQSLGASGVLFSSFYSLGEKSQNLISLKFEVFKATKQVFKPKYDLKMQIFNKEK
jgi:hypothetical protein